LQRKLKKAGWGALEIAENCQNRVIAKIEKQKHSDLHGYRLEKDRVIGTSV